MTEDMMNPPALVETMPNADLLRKMIGFAAERLMEIARSPKPTWQEEAAQDGPALRLQEAGFGGFWIHRVLQDHGVESRVVDAASVAAS